MTTFWLGKRLRNFWKSHNSSTLYWNTCISLNFSKDFTPFHTPKYKHALMVVVLWGGIKNWDSIGYMITWKRRLDRRRQAEIRTERAWYTCVHHYEALEMDSNLGSCSYKWCDLGKVLFRFWDTDSSGVVEDDVHFHLGRLLSRLNTKKIYVWPMTVIWIYSMYCSLLMPFCPLWVKWMLKCHPSLFLSSINENISWNKS